jgi:ABC-2 type transport system permease protein
MLKAVRLFGAIFAVSLQRELAFRANLLFQLLMAAIGIVSSLIALGIVYTQTTTLGGWSLAEAIVLLGTYQIVSGLYTTFVEPNLAWFGGQVRNGTLDNVLLKPVSSIFLASLGSCAPLGLGQALMGIVVLGAGLGELGTIITPWHAAGWLLLLGVGLIVTWASRVLLASLVFWSPGLELDVVYGALWQFGRYPVSIYRQPVRFVLTYILPVAFISTLPARALTRGASLPLLLAGAIVAFFAVIVVRFVWHAGLRRYTSATS